MTSSSTSRWLRGTSLALLVAIAGVGAARADEPPPVAPPAGGAPAAPPGKESLLDRGLAALKVRMEAKLKEAELLEKAGKIDEALAAVRDVERMYREGLDDLQRLIVAVREVVPPVIVVPPPQGKVPNPADPFADGIGPEPGLISPSAQGPGPFPRRGGQTGLLGAQRAEAVLGGLRWLAAHQSEDGSWEAAGFDKWCDAKPNPGVKPDGAGKAMYDPGVTGLALCAFLGAGYSNRGAHEFAKVVRKGLQYLKQVQDPEGCFGHRTTPHYVYNHAFASLAMLEAFGMTQSPVFKGSAQAALNFIALARNPYFVWRYGVKPGDNDMSVTGAMAMVIKSARLINEHARKRGADQPLVIDEESFDGVRAWIDKMTDPDYGRAGYISRGQGPARPQELVDRFPPDRSESMTAVAVLLRIFSGENPSHSDVIQKGVSLMQRLPPSWNMNDGSIDMYYWYYASLALYQVGGDAWATWERALDQAVLKSQRQDGSHCSFKGSWDPVDPWGPDGGRVYSTALMTLCAEVTNRYDRAFGAK